MNSVGFEIESDAVRAIELEIDGENRTLLAAGQLVAPQVGIVQAEGENLELIAEVVKKVWVDLKTSNRQVSFSLQESSVFTRILEMPELSDVELSSAINWEAEQYIPLPLAQVRMRWEIVKKFRNNSNQKRMIVLLAAVPQALVTKYHKVAENAGLILKVLEPQSLSIIRALELFKLKSAYPLIIYFGQEKTNIMISSGGFLSFVRTLDQGGTTLNRMIATTLGITPEQADNYKLTYGLDKTKLNGSLYNIMIPFFNSILTEIKRAIVFHETKDPGHPLSSVILCGSASDIPGLSPLLASTFNLEVVVGDPIPLLKPKKKNPVKIATIANQKFLTAVGLAMNEF